MKGRPLFALLSDEMNRTRTDKKKGERERVREEGEEENSAFV